MIPIEFLALVATAAYQAIASWNEDRGQPPGQFIDVGGRKLHLCALGEGSPTVVLDCSLGGVEGYLLVEALAKLTRVCIYDRAGYGWSDRGPRRRTSEQIVSELDSLLSRAGIDPPYLLVGDSFGSYNMRLYAHRFPEKVVGMVLTDGLHEAAMLEMPVQLQALKLFFMSGFVMSALGSALGIIRLLGGIGMFELLKPELRQFRAGALNSVKRSFYRPKHWLTMLGEMLDLDASGRQLQVANNFDGLPTALVTASSFSRPSLWSLIVPVRAADRLRKTMHGEILKLSTECLQIQADRSGHFVWVDQPEVIVEAVRIVLDKVNSSGKTFSES